MFDIGFLELLVIAVLSLLVMGPERLPETLRGVNLWIGRIRHALSTARREIEDELGMEDVRQQLHNEEVLREIENTKRDTKTLVTQAKKRLKTGD